MARVYYLLNKVEWIAQAQAHAWKARLENTRKQKQKPFGRETLFIHQARLVSDVRMSGGSNGLNKPRMYIYFQSRLVKSRLNVSMGRSQDSRVSDCCEHLSDWSINEIIFFSQTIDIHIFFCRLWPMVIKFYSFWGSFRALMVSFGPNLIGKLSIWKGRKVQSIDPDLHISIPIKRTTLFWDCMNWKSSGAQRQGTTPPWGTGDNKEWAQQRVHQEGQKHRPAVLRHHW